MRPLLYLALLLPVVSAAPATDPYIFRASLDADPAVGAPVIFRLVVEAREALDAPLRLDAPSWVEIDEPRVWHAKAAAGERIEHEWRLVATRAGFWRASLAVEAERAGAYAAPVEEGRAWHVLDGCCLFAWSTEKRGLWSTEAQNAVPGESTVGFHPRARVMDEQQAELIVRVSPQDRRYVGQELVLQVEGSEARTAPADAPHEFSHIFPLAAGEQVRLEAAAWVRVTFEEAAEAGGPYEADQPVTCARIDLLREGDQVREVARAGCAAEAPITRAPVPSGPWALALLLALACGLILRRI